MFLIFLYMELFPSHEEEIFRFQAVSLRCKCSTVRECIFTPARTYLHLKNLLLQQILNNAKVIQSFVHLGYDRRSDFHPIL